MASFHGTVEMRSLYIMHATRAVEITHGVLVPLRVATQEVGTMKWCPVDTQQAHCFPSLEMASESPPILAHSLLEMARVRPTPPHFRSRVVGGISRKD